VKIIAALKADLRSTDLIASAEVDSSMKEAKTAIDNLHTWMKPEEKSVPLVHKPGSGCIVKEPYGLVLIISPVPIPPCSMPPHTHTHTHTHTRARTYDAPNMCVCVWIISGTIRSRCY
jgi:hypothetical protein